GIYTYGKTGLFVANASTLRLWNAGDPKHPSFFSQIAIPGAQQIEVRGSLVVVAGSDAFTFVDLTRPETPRIEYSYATPVQGNHATFVGANVVLPMGTMGFSVIAAARTLTGKGTVVFPVGGVSTTVSLAGGGTAHVITTDAGGGAIAGIDVVGGTDKSALTIRTAGGAAITGGNISVTGSLKSLSASSLDLQGNLAVTGSLETLRLHSASGGHTFTIAATDASKNPAAALRARLDSVSDLAIDSEIPIASLTVGTWASLLPAADSIAAPSLGTLNVRQVQTALPMPTVPLDRFASARPLVKVTNTGGSPYLIAVGAGGVLYDITFASLAHWPATALTYALAPTSGEVVAALALKGIHV
ncbi:MAG: hypothetical protein NT031_11515, partial [Planctomycetota bacterium]|nr:hypothetical protein [Planctomycetota bacterium]